MPSPREEEDEEAEEEEEEEDEPPTLSKQIHATSGVRQSIADMR